LEVCADTAVKGDWSGSGTSMMADWDCGGGEKEEDKKLNGIADRSD
jgi:hypothetical protein